MFESRQSKQLVTSSSRRQLTLAKVLSSSVAACVSSAAIIQLSVLSLISQCSTTPVVTKRKSAVLPVEYDSRTNCSHITSDRRNWLPTLSCCIFYRASARATDARYWYCAILSVCPLRSGISML